MTGIAFLGLGAMGSRMALRLLRAGHAVTVWNRTRERTRDLARAGASVAASPRAAVAGCEVVLSMVYDDAASQSVWLDPVDGALAGMEAGSLAVECSTVSPGHVRHLHAAAAARDLAILDAPVAGSRPQAEAGELVFMAGGDAGVFATAAPLFADLGKAAFHVGDAGTGALVKLMVNVLLAAQTATLAELLGLAERAGTDPAAAMSVIEATAVASPAIAAGGRAMLARAFAPAAPVDLIVKDLGLALRAGEGTGSRLPMTAAGVDVFERAARAGFGADNLTGVLKLYAGGGPDAVSATR
jgi:3-hydroxyisobutyrate dehydrogenase